MSAMSHMGLIHWTEPGLEIRNQASGSGYTGSLRLHRLLLAFIMPHYYLHSPSVIHTAVIIHCRWMSGLLGMFTQRWGFAEVCVCWRTSVCLSVVRAWMCIPSSLLHFSGKSFLLNHCENYVVFPLCKLWKEICKVFLLSGCLKYLKPKKTTTNLRLSLMCTVLLWIPWRISST